jgi:hypothetical protein
MNNGAGNGIAGNQMKDGDRILFDMAYDIADAYRAGLLSHLRESNWPETWKALLTELKQRCPGFSDAQYRQALDRGFLDSR